MNEWMDFCKATSYYLFLPPLQKTVWDLGLFTHAKPPEYEANSKEMDKKSWHKYEKMIKISAIAITTWWIRLGGGERYLGFGTKHNYLARM